MDFGQKKYSIVIGSRVIDFYLTPATEKNRPIIFILHGHGHTEIPSRFSSPNWNVVCPMDPFGFEGLGSWYLGENNDFFWLDGMQSIVEQVRSITGTGRLYFWGSSMGGYAALLHGHRLNAAAIYANVPQTLLLGSQYSENGMKKYFAPIFGNTTSELNDLKLAITQRTRAKLFLCFNQLEGSDYFSEQGLAFVNHIHKLLYKMYLEVRPQNAHGKNHSVSQAIELFKTYSE